MADHHGTEPGRVELAETFAEMARELMAADSLPETLARICKAGVSTVDGCDHAGVSLVRKRKITTEGASDGVPNRVDAIQYEVGDGPCLSALSATEVIHVDDLTSDSRWPAFSSRAAKETGVRSMLSFRLFVAGDTLGALSLYTRAASAFDDEADLVGAVLAAHASVAILSATQAADKDEAIRTRDVIGQAKGILMASRGVSEDEAFELLRVASQRLNVKLRDVAAGVRSGESLGEERPDRPKRA
ncbi:MAG TPA: GAF and ANTAR domain-containing protein [Acidimicrobiales bacterium]|nr:GAF and ANTAR domain-containing protein [Acidimicrobiales bacterium]